jgi:hypothetical protein
MPKHRYFCQGPNCPGLPYPVPPAHWAFHPHTCGQGHTKPASQPQTELVANLEDYVQMLDTRASGGPQISLSQIAKDLREMMEELDK